MLRRSARTTPLYAVALATMVLALFAAPAAAHKEGTGGKKAVGTIASFDGTTLSVTMNDGSTFTSAVADDAKVKVEHRGHKAHGKGHKKPSNGSFADLTAGTFVLKMKSQCDEVTKLRIRRAPATEPVVTEPVTTEPTETETETEEPTESETETETEDETVEAASDETEETEVEEPETEETETEETEVEDDGCEADDDADDTEEADESTDDSDTEEEEVEEDEDLEEVVEDVVEELPTT